MTFKFRRKKITAIYSGSDLLLDVLLSHREQEEIFLIPPLVSRWIFTYTADLMRGYTVSKELSLDTYHLP